MSLNLYTYCYNNPIMYTDPTGHFGIFGIEFGNPIEGAKELFMTSEEEREQTFETIRQYGGDDGYTKFVSNMGAGLAETGDLFKNPIKQMHENNQVMKSVVTQDLGIKEGTKAYKVIKNIGTSVEAVGINGINLGKGTVQLGETLIKPIANTMTLGTNYAMMQTGFISEDNFNGWYDSWYAGAEAGNQEFINLVPNMVKGLGNSAVGLYSNGLNFFNPNATLEQKTQAVGDFYNVAFAVEGAKSFYETGLPYIRNAMGSIKNAFSPQVEFAGYGRMSLSEANSLLGDKPMNVSRATSNNAGISNGSKTIYSNEQLINASNDIHLAQYGNAWWGKKNPVSVTQATDGTVVVSKNNGIIGRKSRAKATEIFGDDVVIVKGRGTNYNNAINEVQTLSPNHAEARGIQALIKRNIDVAGARQATTLPSCGDCTGLQRALKVKNLTGSVNK